MERSGLPLYPHPPQTPCSVAHYPGHYTRLRQHITQMNGHFSEGFLPHASSKSKWERRSASVTRFVPVCLYARATWGGHRSCLFTTDTRTLWLCQNSICITVTLSHSRQRQTSVQWHPGFPLALSSVSIFNIYVSSLIHLMLNVPDGI